MPKLKQFFSLYGLPPASGSGVFAFRTDIHSYVPSSPSNKLKGLENAPPISDTERLPLHVELDSIAVSLFSDPNYIETSKLVYVE